MKNIMANTNAQVTSSFNQEPLVPRCPHSDELCRKRSMHYIEVVFLLVTFLLIPQRVWAEEDEAWTAPQIHTIVTNASAYVDSKLPRYAKFEITFQLDSAANNLYMPYDESPPPGVDAKIGVSVDAQFTPDNWETIYTVPAFYFQGFEHQIDNGQDWIYPTPDHSWKVRFAPNQVGNWQYRISAIDKGGSAVPVTGNFEVVASASHGFVRASRNDSRYFEFDDGTYFPGQGYNMTYNQDEWLNPIQSNQRMFQKMGQNGLQLARLWLTQWSIYSSAWNPWTGAQQNYPSNVPATSMHGSWDPVNSHSEWVIQMRYPPNEYFDSCMFVNPQLSQPAVKPNTNYQIQIRYYGENIAQACAGDSNCGFALSIGGWRWGPQCQSGSGQILGSLMGDTDTNIEGGWVTITRTWASGTNHFLPELQMRLEHIPDSPTVTPLAFVSSVTMKEDQSNGVLGPNILAKDSMDYHLNMAQRNAFVFDKVVEAAEQNGVYLRPVILEKGERFLQSYNEQGVLGGENIDHFYGDFRTLTKTRWLQQAWWRYLQARWGYSTAIHSWELMNEADPNSSRAHTLVDEFGKYMHCRVFGSAVGAGDAQNCLYDHPNEHLISTSFWHSYPRDSFWANPNFPNVDYVNIHQYIPKLPTNEGECGGYCYADPNFYDSAMATFARSLEYGAQEPTGADKPVLRGETGFTEQNYHPLSAELLQDTQGIWLHNFVWGGINYAGMLEAYWGTPYHIVHDGIDLHPIYKRYYDFIQSVPLSNGLYRNAAARLIPENGALRAWGQKDNVNGFAEHAHLWIANAGHTWKAVIDNTVTSASGTVVIPGLRPNATYALERWDTYTGLLITEESVAANAQGEVTFPVNSLLTDFAIKLALTNAPIETATPTETPTNTPTITPSPTSTTQPTQTPTPVVTATPAADAPVTIVIAVSAEPKSIQNFTFNSSLGNFKLDDPSTDDKDELGRTKKFTTKAGTYTFTQAKLAHWTPSSINCTDGKEAANVQLEKRSISVTANPGDKINCTFVNQRLVNLQGIAFNDLNGDGVHTEDEPYLPGWEITFYDLSNQPLSVQATGSDGRSTLTNIKPGLYKICQTPQNGWNNSLPYKQDTQLAKHCYSVMPLPGQQVSVFFGNTQGPVTHNGEDIDLTDAVVITPLPDIDEKEEEEIPVETPLQKVYLPLVSR